MDEENYLECIPVIDKITLLANIQEDIDYWDAHGGAINKKRDLLMQQIHELLLRQQEELTKAVKP